MDENSITRFQKELRSAIEDFGIAPLLPEQSQRLAEHYSLLNDWNRRLNLTRITAPKDAARRHYAESLCGARLIGDGRKVLDVGSGAGFPGIPLAVIRPDLSVTALEPNLKKAIFLREAKARLGLTNFEVDQARLEDFDWSKYDLLVSRAIDRAEQMIPAIIRMMKPPQALLYYCTSDFVAKMGSCGVAVKVIPVPESESRLLAMFTPTL